MLRPNATPNSAFGPTQASFDVLIASCTDVIENHPRDAQAYYKRGVAYLQKGRRQKLRGSLGNWDLDRAIADFTTAIRMGVQGPDVYIERGIAQQANGNPDRAIADLSEAIRIAPQDPRAYLARACVFENKGQTD